MSVPMVHPAWQLSLLHWQRCIAGLLRGPPRCHAGVVHSRAGRQYPNHPYLLWWRTSRDALRLWATLLWANRSFLRGFTECPPRRL
ncbi:hypothetical protein BCR44DRAFT_1443143 [Catenaria anguillulae PL171]|uniref:Uncharacterized protein n=1 Tax=Catenaria anguillulae PL171 TaxID=765915 RepID=A0A1Y2H924_9FUNG|nr:hypothetical protein BCR44DRAFT_1443143 [Catenaria anguillulae PL171]